MTFIFALRNRDSEDHGEVVPALVLNIILACFNAITFVLSSSAAWLRRKKDPPSVKVLYYGSMISSSVLSAILFVYRASHRVADLVIFSILLAKLKAVAGKLKLTASTAPLPVKSGSTKVIPTDTVRPFSSPEHSATTVSHVSRPKTMPPALPASEDGKPSGQATSVERGRGFLSTEEAMKMLNDSVGQIRAVVVQMLVLSGVLVSVPALAHRPFIMFAYMHVTKFGGGISALLVLDGHNLREARKNVTQALSSITRVFPSARSRAHEGTLPCDVTASGNYPTATT